MGTEGNPFCPHHNNTDCPDHAGSQTNIAHHTHTYIHGYEMNAWYHWVWHIHIYIILIVYLLECSGRSPAVTLQCKHYKNADTRTAQQAGSGVDMHAGMHTHNGSSRWDSISSLMRLDNSRDCKRLRFDKGERGSGEGRFHTTNGMVRGIQMNDILSIYQDGIVNRQYIPHVFRSRVNALLHDKISQPTYVSA